MEKSSFKFSNPKLIKLDFEVNNDLDKNVTSTNVEFSLNSKIDKINEQEADVELDIKIGEKSDNFPFFIHLIIGSKFKLEEVINGTNFDALLSINAPTLLLSYARPIIASITLQAGMKPLNIPFFNFTK